MNNILIKDVEKYSMEVKETTFIYKDRKFVYKVYESPSYSESFIIDLNNSDKRLSESELESLKNKIEEIFDDSDFEIGEEISF
jgi:hypothetical protein